MSVPFTLTEEQKTLLEAAAALLLEKGKNTDAFLGVEEAGKNLLYLISQREDGAL